MSVERGGEEFEREPVQQKRPRRRNDLGNGYKHKPRGRKPEVELRLRETKLVRIDVPNVEGANLSRCDAEKIADEVFHMLVGGDPVDSGSEGSGREDNCWLVSSVLSSCTHGNGTTGTCRIDTFECADGRSYTVTTPLN